MLACEELILPPVLDAIPHLLAQLDRESYVAEPAIATSLHLATQLRKPLLVEGHAGVGKTEIAKVLARVLETDLIRLQCYEGLDASTALYEWRSPTTSCRSWSSSSPSRTTWTWPTSARRSRSRA